MGRHSAKLGPWFLCAFNSTAGFFNESNEIPVRFMGFRWGIMKFRGLRPDYWILRISIMPAGGGGGGIRGVPAE